ncbi:MAG: insulinase family protein [Myxococcales bacterium]|nr:insulinase family protein [Myxococcales bacterium]
MDMAACSYQHARPMKRPLGLGIAALLGALAGPTAAAPDGAKSVEASAKAVIAIPFVQQTLPNGLTVILHEDHTSPLVVVNVNVAVGSRDEKAKRTGFAHLFEHLMFMGTERVPEKAFDAWMEKEGGSNNAWTSQDRTDYYDVGPSHSLPLLLWLEADRFSVLGQQLTEDKLDTQRDVVKNERRQQVENQPYGKAELALPELLYPVGHAYHHPVIGSHEDLEAASVADVRAFFAEHYVPPNTSLVIAGDFDPKATMPLVEKYFGSIPGAKAPARAVTAAPVVLAGEQRLTLEDNVSLPKIIMAWHSPPHFAPGDAELDLFAAVLSSGKASRLYQPLVYDKQLAQSVHAYQSSQALGSYFAIEAIARPGVSLDDLEREIDIVIASVVAAAVSEAELGRARILYESSFVSRVQSLATRASMLNGYYAERGDPGFIQADLDRYLRATPAELLRYAQSTLAPKARVVLRIVPKAETEKKP